MAEICNRSESNSLLNKIAWAIKRTGDDEHFIAALKFHLRVIQASGIDKNKPSESKLKSDDELCDLFISKLFIDKMDVYPIKRFEGQFNDCSGWPVPVLPCEYFGETKLTTDYRRKLFYRCLKVGDILDCSVTSISPNEFELKVIHKYGVSKIVDDLNLMVVMPRDKSDLSLMWNDFQKFELVRVAVTEIIKDGDVATKVSVTISDNRQLPEPYRPQLGKISEKDLPAYILNPPLKTNGTYADYLDSQPGFKNHLTVNDIIEGIGLDLRGDYSFFHQDECFQNVDANELLKESKLKDFYSHVDSWRQNFKKGDLQSALNHLTHAINISPQKEQDKVHLSKLLQVRGDMHAEILNPKMNLNAVKDWEQAYITDRNNKSMKENLSKALFKASCILYRENQYEAAAEAAERALQLDGNNAQASKFLDRLKRKHSNEFINLDEESLLALQEKKMEIVSELKKFRAQAD